MPCAEDEHPIGDFRPGGEHEPFRISVREGAPGGRGPRPGRLPDRPGATCQLPRVNASAPIAGRTAFPVQSGKPAGLYRVRRRSTVGTREGTRQVISLHVGLCDPHCQPIAAHLRARGSKCGDLSLPS